MNVYGVVARHDDGAPFLENETVMLITEPCEKDPEGSFLALTGMSRGFVFGMLAGDTTTLTIVHGPYVSKKMGAAMTGDTIHWSRTR